MISASNIKASDKYVTNLPSKSSSSAYDDKDYGKQCEPSGTGDSSMNVTRQHMCHDPMIPVGKVGENLCKEVEPIKVTNRVSQIRKPITPKRNIGMIQPTSENHYYSKQPLSSGTRTEQVISIKICELFTEMQTKLEEEGLQINCLWMRHIEPTYTFNKIIDAINKQIDLKYAIPHASIPKELMSVVPPTVMRQEEEAGEESERNKEEHENRVGKLNIILVVVSLRCLRSTTQRTPDGR